MPIGVRMKLSHFAILALVAPIALAAQQPPAAPPANPITTAFRTRRSEEHTSELQSQSNLVCRLLLEKKNASNLLGSPSKRRISGRYLARIPCHARAAILPSAVIGDHSVELVTVAAAEVFEPRYLLTSR